MNYLDVAVAVGRQQAQNRAMKEGQEQQRNQQRSGQIQQLAQMLQKRQEQQKTIEELRRVSMGKETADSGEFFVEGGPLETEGGLKAFQKTMKGVRDRRMQIRQWDRETEATKSFRKWAEEQEKLKANRQIRLEGIRHVLGETAATTQNLREAPERELAANLQRAKTNYYGSGTAKRTAETDVIPKAETRKRDQGDFKAELEGRKTQAGIELNNREIVLRGREIALKERRQVLEEAKFVLAEQVAMARDYNDKLAISSRMASDPTMKQILEGFGAKDKMSAAKMLLKMIDVHEPQSVTGGRRSPASSGAPAGGGTQPPGGAQQTPQGGKYARLPGESAAEWADRVAPK